MIKTNYGIGSSSWMTCWGMTRDGDCAWLGRPQNSSKRWIIWVHERDEMTAKSLNATSSRVTKRLDNRAMVKIRDRDIITESSQSDTLDQVRLKTTQSSTHQHLCAQPHPTDDICSSIVWPKRSIHQSEWVSIDDQIDWLVAVQMASWPLDPWP